MRVGTQPYLTYICRGCVAIPGKLDLFEAEMRRRGSWPIE